MLKKLIVPALILLNTAAFAAGKDGLHIQYRIHIDNGAKPIVGTADYYYQGRNYLAIINTGDETIGKTIYLEQNGRKYTLFPKEKTFMEVKEFESGLSSFIPHTDGAFTAIANKKKIMGYKCNMQRKEAENGITNVCLSPLLYKNWGMVWNKMESKESALGQMQGFPVEIVTLTNKQANQTTVTLSMVRQKDYSKIFEIMRDYKKKETPDVQASSTKMLNNMKTTTPKSQQELDEMEKMTREANKKFQPTKEEQPILP